MTEELHNELYEGPVSKREHKLWNGNDLYEPWGQPVPANLAEIEAVLRETTHPNLRVVGEASAQ